jgi:carbon monoxide dehydrogenase subunit G
MAKVEGRETLALPRAEVWRRLNDPDVLAESIPGCSGFESIGENRFQTSITVAIGPVRGAYAGTVTYRDVQEPERCTIAVEGRGDKGTIEGEGAITLTESGASTDVSYVGTFKLTGPVAGVGQRLAPGISRRMIVETLRQLEAADGGCETPAKPGETDSGALAQASDAPRASGEAPAAASGSPPRPAADRSADFRPLALPIWSVFALGVALGVVVTIILEAVL